MSLPTKKQREEIKNKPLEPEDFFGQFQSVPDTFGNVKTKETTRELAPFNPKEFSNVDNPTPYDDKGELNIFNAANQPKMKQTENMFQQFGANFASGFGQGLANLVDVSSWFNDNYQSNIMGVSTKDMQDWASGVAQRNQILRENPGEFEPGSFDWWMEQTASAGTGLGMAAFALAETAAIEAATGGMGTGVALGRLGNLFKNIKKIRGAEGIMEATKIAKDLRSAATLYGVLSRTNESRMEAMSSYDEITRELSGMKNSDGTRKYTDDQVKQFAAEGADKTYLGNLALLPLDILAFRAMVYNPISGTSKGFLENQLARIGNKAVSKGVGFTIGAGLEGTEEGFQFVASEEGKHYAKVLGGINDGSDFVQRLGVDLSKDEFWNNFAGGVIGSPIISGGMNIANKFISGKRTSMLNSVHSDFIKNVAKMDDGIVNKIKSLQEQGKDKEANVLRRQFRASKALSALHLDAMTDKDSAFNSYTNFLQGTLDEINQGKLDSLNDLGFANPTKEQLEYIKTNFQQSIKDANELKSIYDNVKDKYSRNFVPEITQSHFVLSKLNEAAQENAQKVTAMQADLLQYNQLSSQGKELHEVEYKLTALMNEQARLNQLYRDTTDDYERQNVDQLIELNKKKIIETKNKVKEINQDESYTESQKTTDADILSAAIKDRFYTEAIQEKEHLENAVMLQRKNVALYNNKGYMKSRMEKAVSKASSSAHLESTKESLTEEDKTIVEPIIQDKQNEISAKEAASQLQQNTTGTIPGNANLFEEDNNLINQITSSTVPTVATAETLPANEVAGTPETAELLLLPNEYDFEKSSSESKAKIINGVKGLADRLEGVPSFEKLIRHIVKVQGVSVADTTFNAVKWGWEQAGFAAEDYSAVYDKVFGNPMQDLISGVESLTPVQAKEQVTKITNDVIAKGQQPEGFDNNNQPVYIYKGVITNEASPKMAFATRLSQAMQATDEEGNILVSHEYTTNDINQGDYVESLQLLDPDKYEAGTELIAEVPSNFNDIKIPIFKPDGTKDTSVTFGQYVAQKGLSPDSQEYKDKLPIIIYNKNHSRTEKGVAFVHDIGWYNPLNFNQEFKGEMEKAIANTREIRQGVINNKGKAEIIITGKRETTFAGLKQKVGEELTLREANPETQLTVALTTDSLSTSKNNIVYPNDNTVLVNNTPFQIGQVLDVRRYGKRDGKKSYLALPVIKPKLDDISKSSVLQAINIYANRSNTDPQLRAKHKVIVDSIINTMGLDILSAKGLESYLHHFITTLNVDKATGDNANEIVAAQAKAKLKEGTPYLAFTASGNIVFGFAGQPAFVKGNTKVPAFFINPNSTKPNTAIANLAKPNFINWYEQNVNLSNLNINKPVVTIDRELNTGTASNSYRDFLLDRLKTNIKSINIGSEQSPNYVTNIQPVITYELKSKLQTQLANKTKEELSENIEKRPSEDSAGKESEESISDIEREILERAKKDLGSDFGISKDDTLLFSPQTLSEGQRKYVTESINRIAGLTPDQQFDVVDFIYNKITETVNLDNKQVTRAEVDKIVATAWRETIEPIRVEYKQRITELNKLVEEKPELKNSSVPDVIKDYQYRLDKISAVETNFNVLYEEAYNRVAKYTGIKQARVQLDNSEEANEETTDDKVEDEGNERERDFWTDVLQENPESRLSYSMRRFFGQIRAYDKNGKLVNGFLGLPKYTGSDTVTRTLMVTLADVPSNFDTMLAKLESVKEGIPWMEEVITRLKGATVQQKNQFVTVMSNTKLRMKFTMISYNIRNQSWTTKVYDTNLNGVADSVRSEWNSNFRDSDLTIKNDEGTYSLNKTRALSLMNTFENWKGVSLKEVASDMSPLWDSLISRVKIGKPVVFKPTGAMLQEFKTNIVKVTDRMRFSLKNNNYQVTNLGDNSFQISFVEQNAARPEQVDAWLRNFGIVLSPKTLDELLTKGLFHNYQQRKPNDLFTTDNGLFQILYNSLKSLVEKPADHDFTEQGDSPLDNSVINSLANLESKYNTTNTPFGFRDNGKSFFALTAPKFITDRTRDLKIADSVIRKQLHTISFSKNSFWLSLLEGDNFRDKFQVSHIGANAFKQLGKRLYKDNAINKLSEVDHELTKLGMFWDTVQGEVTYTGVNEKGQPAELKTFPGTNIPMRMATMFSPTMSDKHMMTLLTTAVLDLKNKDLSDGLGVSTEVKKVIYDQIIKPELLRMIKFYQNGGKTNISAYDKGAGLFLLMPDMNNVEYAPGLKLIDAVKHQSEHFTIPVLEANEEMMKDIYNRIDKYISTLVDEKLQIWENSGLLTRGELTDQQRAEGLEQAPIGELHFFDKKYLDRFNGTPQQKANMAATDYVVNSLIANANSFMLFAGDPAMYFKSGNTSYLQMSKDTFTNAGKRLANQIAPGTTLSNSEHERYIQIFLEDRKSLPEIPFLKFVTKINDGHEITDEEINTLQTGTKEAREAIAEKYPVASGYFNIEGSDAQEYTTWKEHLDILEKLGKTPDTLIDITADEIAEARELFSSDITRNKLTEKQMLLLGKVLQPIKPVYTGQIFDAKQDVMRTVYIKSSSFPLIPQLTAGFEIDKLRQKMEQLQAVTKVNVRASYQSANKVGSVNTAISIWNPDGTINEDEVNSISSTKGTLVLDRKNFRIQQEVPFKSAKVGEDKITLGTQLMKLLFGDEILNYNEFNYNGQIHTGKELHNTYNRTFIQLVSEKRSQLFTELGLDEKGVPIDVKKSMNKLQKLLKDEAIKRGYPLQDIEGLTLNNTLDAAGNVVNSEFNLPLWASSNSNRYESMLNAIITNRLIRMKFPGNSFVVGSEEGFRVSEDLENVDKSKIIWTSSWNGKNLQASYHQDGKLKKAQVLVSSKFKNSDGVLIDLFEKVNGEYKYITKSENGFYLKENMFDKELLSITTFRIPTSGHQSASQVEIVGFLPAQSADLMIVPRNFTKQKGLDFDIDKENTYQLWNFMTDEGKFEVLQEKHRAAILAKADKLFKENIKVDASVEKLLTAIFGDVSSADIEDYTDAEISADKKLARLNSKITEKLLQNEIIKLTSSVLSSDDVKVQAKISKTLNTDFAEAQANFIDSISDDHSNQYWTALSDEYQKQKMITGASGKIGTGAYSLDVVFHSLAQQAALTGKPIQLIEVIEHEDSEPTIRNKEWRFGKIVSNGTLGGVNTLDGGRSISSVNGERQNVAVDNEKLQIMGRVNLNNITMDVDKVMNLLGFDKGEDGNSISFLFLSQPIIKEFVNKVRNANSNMAEFELDKEGAVFDELIEKYDPESQETIDDAYWKTMSSLMTNENFINNIKASKPDGKFQAAVLRRFMEMKKYGIAIRSVQTTINTDSKGLGKSFFDVIEKRNALNRLGRDTNMITGASGLIGDYINKEEASDEQKQQAAERGYEDIGEFYVKPDTLSGAFNIYGVTTAYNMWTKYFPYDAEVTQKAFTEVLSIISSEDASGSKVTELKQEIFKGMKKYFAASRFNGIISENDNINQERARLFIDSDENVSLAKYLKTIRSMTDNPAVNTFIRTNKLLNRFEFDIQKNGQPSLIKFNNAAGEEFDEQYLYESLSTLIEKRGKTGSVELPEVGNKKYTLDTLAQDLIAYCYLGNATQEAIQFTKYTPVSYLDAVGFSDKMRKAAIFLKSDPGILGVKLGNKETEKHLVSEFTMQFIQHNPERVKYKMDNSNFAKRTIKGEGDTFQLRTEERPTFISVYDPTIPKGQKKFRLYWFDGEKYVRIPVLGVFGMDEYQKRNEIGISLVNGKVKTKAAPQAIVKDEIPQSSSNDLFNVRVGNITSTVQAIAETNTTSVSQLAKYLLPFAEGVNIKVADVYTTGGKSYTNFKGVYDLPTKTIYVSDKITHDASLLAETVVHELVHHLTLSKVNPYIISQPNGSVEVKANAPLYVTNLVRIYNNLRTAVDEGKVLEVAKKVHTGKNLSTEELNNYYAFTNIDEFMAMTLTRKEFQQMLAKVEYKTTGVTFLQRIKEVISQVLEAIGVKFDEKFTAAHAINAIFDIIENKNDKPGNNDLFDGLHDADNSEMSFSPMTQVEKYNREYLDKFINQLTSKEKDC